MVRRIYIFFDSKDALFPLIYLHVPSYVFFSATAYIWMHHCTFTSTSALISLTSLAALLAANTAPGLLRHQDFPAYLKTAVAERHPTHGETGSILRSSASSAVSGSGSVSGSAGEQQQNAFARDLSRHSIYLDYESPHYWAVPSPLRWLDLSYSGTTPYGNTNDVENGVTRRPSAGGGIDEGGVVGVGEIWWRCWKRARQLDQRSILNVRKHAAPSSSYQVHETPPTATGKEDEDEMRYCVIANDIHRGAIELAIQAAAAAGVHRMIKFSCQDVRSLLPPVLIDNDPTYAPFTTAGATNYNDEAVVNEAASSTVGGMRSSTAASEPVLLPGLSASAALHLPRLLVVTNPPWGMRLEAGAEQAWMHLGVYLDAIEASHTQALKQRQQEQQEQQQAVVDLALPSGSSSNSIRISGGSKGSMRRNAPHQGASAWMLTADIQLANQLRRKPVSVLPLKVAATRLQFVEYIV